MAIGFDIVIPDTLLKKITDADDKLQALAITAEDTQKRVNSAFKAMVDGDLNDFIKKLEQVNKEVSKLGDAKLQIDSTNTTKNIDDINKLVAALEKLLTIQKKAPNGKESRNNIIYNIGEQAEQSIDKINKLINSIDKIQFGGQTYTNSALTKVNSEIDSAVEKLTELQKRINFYAKGEGQKSIAYVDIKSMNEEAKILMNQIDLLQRKRESIIANANLRLRVDEQRRIRDNAWFEMEEEKRQRERENAKQASDRARESSKEYERTYNDAIKAYSEMFDVLEAKQLKVYENLFIEAEKREKQETKRIDEQIKEYDNIIQKLKELYEIKNKADQVKGDFNYSSALSINAAQVSDDTLKQIQELNRRRFELENELLDKLDDVKAKHREKNFNEELKFEEKANAEAEKKRKKRIADESKQRKKDYERIMATGDTYDHTLRVSNRAKTLNQELLAVKALERERGKLKKTDADYEQKLNELNKRILEHNASIDKARAGAKKLRNSHSNLMNISEQLTRRLALVFSVSQVTGYVKKLASVRGEFELQQKALAAIIQNKDKANEIFDKVTKLAVQSPFQLKELVTYTKQLAAYKIETGKIYDNMKMLADISAGVGVDMSRLVLAYGQVAAANYLRGTELRQFSEAGVNILGGLADYFSELQGRAVGVAEVFDMVSRRMVKFSDVEAVLRKMTERGGEFYNMQAIQAQTLKGQISNLKDSIEIMLNEIGKSHEGTLKGSVALLKDLVENWRAFSYILEDVGAILAAITLGNFYKGLTLTGTKLLDVAANGRGAIAMAAKLKQGVSGLTKALSVLSKTKLGVIGVILALVKAGWNWHRSIKAQNAVYDETIDTLGNMSDRANSIAQKYTAVGERLANAESIMRAEAEKGNTATKEYNDAQIEANYARQEQLQLLEKLKAEYPEIYNGLKQEEDGTINLTEAMKEFNAITLANMGLQQAMKATAFLDGWKKQVADVEEELQEYDNAVQNAIGVAQESRNIIVSLRDNINESDAQSLKLLDAIVTETDLEKKKQLLKEFNDFYYNNSKNMSGQAKKAAKEVMLAYQTMREEMVGGAMTIGFNQPLINLTNNQYKSVLAQFQGELYSMASNVDITTDNGKLAIQNLYKGMFKGLELSHPELVKQIEEKFKQDLGEDFGFIWTFGIDVEIGKPNITINKPEWQKAIEDELAAAASSLPKLNDAIFKDFLSLAPNNTFEIPMPTFDAKRGIAESYEDWVKRFKKVWDEVKDLQERAHGVDQALFSNAQRKNIDLMANAFENAAKSAGLVKAETEKAIDKTPEQIRVLKEMHKAYLDLNKTFDETTSKQGAIQKFGNAFKEAFGVNVDQWGFDFTTEDGVVAAFDKLIKSIPDQKKRVQAELAKGEFVMEYKLQTQKDADKKVKDDIEKMFSDYESLLELDKLGISGDFAKSLFNIDTTELSEIRKKIEEELSKAEAQGGREYFVAERKKELEKVTQMEVKAQQERLQKYLQYTRDAISERAKLELQGAKNLAEIEKTWAQAKKDIEEKYAISDKDSADEIARKTEEKTNALLALESSKPQAIEGVRKEMQGALQELDWKEFSSSDTFVSIFNDLENTSTQALTSMIDQLEKYKSEWTDLPIDQMEAIAKQLEKMKNARDVNEAVANPFKSGAFADGRLKAEDISKAQQDMISADESILASNQQISNAEYLLQLLNEEKNLKDQSVVKGLELAKLGINYTQTTKEQKEILEKVIKNEQKNVNTQKQNKENAQDVLDLAEKQKAVLEAQSKYLGEGLQMANDLYDAFNGLYEALGGDKDSPVAIFADMGMNMANTVTQTIQLQIQLDIARQSATGLGIAMNTAMGVIGWIVMAVQLLTTALSAIAKAHDNALQKQIERDAEAVELLQKRFEKLEKAIDDAMSFGKYQKEFDEAKRNLEEQIRLTRDMIALEEAKKKTDKDAIKGYKDEIEDYNEQLKEMEEKRIEDMGGFGSDEAYKDAAQSFIDAWLDAYRETGDGLEALQEQWDEYFNNILKKQLLMKVGEKYIKGLLDDVDRYIDDDGRLDNNEIDALTTEFNNKLPELNNALKQLMNNLGVMGGLGSGGKLEGLSESIQGVTEVTAQALEAILNSMRFYVIDNNKQLIEIANTLLSWESPTSPILAELKAQTSYLSSIESLFNSVVDRNGSPAVRVR